VENVFLAVLPVRIAFSVARLAEDGLTLINIGSKLLLLDGSFEILICVLCRRSQ